MSESITVSLKNPIRFGGIFNKNVVEIVTVKKPLVKDLMGLDFSPEKMVESQSILISRLTGIPLNAIREMPFQDYSRLVEALNKLLEREP